MWATRLGYAACIGAYLFASGAAHADGAPQSPAESSDESGDDSVSRARQAFIEGATLAKEERWPEAIAAFRRSLALRQHAGTTYNIAFCERALGKWSRAYVHFAKALADNDAHGGAELPDTSAEGAREYMREAEARIAKVTEVRVRPLGATVTVDGLPLATVEPASSPPTLIVGTGEPGEGSSTPAGPFRLWADPGPHVFVLSAAGLAPTRVTKVIAEGTTASLDIEAEPAPSPEVTRNIDRAERINPVVESGSTRNVAMFAAFGVGGLGIAVGSVAGLMAFNKRSDLGERCPGGNCPPDARAEYDETGRLATIADVSFGIGLAGVAVGSVLLLWPRDDYRTTNRTDVRLRSEVRVGVLPGPVAGVSGAF